MNDEREEQEKTKGFRPTEIVTNKQYRAIAILIFYFFLFAFLIISIRISDKKAEMAKKDGNQDIIENGTIKGFELIKNNNFSYKYILQVNDDLYVYEGKRFQNKDSFTLTSDNSIKNYIIVDTFAYEIVNNETVMTDKPYYYIDFLDTSVIENIINTAKKSSNRIYSINNKSLDALNVKKIGVNNRDKNKIILHYDNGVITRIDFDYTNYVSFDNSGIKRVFLTLEYSNFGSIDDFDVKN